MKLRQNLKKESKERLPLEAKVIATVTTLPRWCIIRPRTRVTLNRDLWIA